MWTTMKLYNNLLVAVFGGQLKNNEVVVCIDGKDYSVTSVHLRKDRKFVIKAELPREQTH